MNKEQLIAAGVSEQVADAVLKLHQQSIDGNYVPKATFEAERTKVKELDQQVKDRDSQITELGKFKGTAEQLQTKVTELEQKNSTATTEFNNKVTQMERDFAIKTAIADKVIDTDDVLPKLDQNLIVFKDGKIVSGLTEQLDTLKQSKPHYFKPEQTEKKPGGFNFFGATPPEGQQTAGKTTEQVKLTKDAEFGKQLAQSRTGNTGSNNNAADAYFK